MNHKVVSENWKEGEWRLPGFSCITFADGQVIILNYEVFRDTAARKKVVFCGPLCDTTIESMEKYEPLLWTEIDPWTKVAYEDGYIFGGSGAMGNEGFIAHTDQQYQLQWGIFFVQTNPIRRVEIHHDNLIAINEHEELQIQINLKNLTEITVHIIE
ncbi:hypothetical protein [Listeria costaricensis]|uniref:hypothetical protein n=1 Tax=Listeria costaricensis TaxID=2026604 RepID=UPI000C072003|nr:hypothetical protein [Listeria costaricensis]